MKPRIVASARRIDRRSVRSMRYVRQARQADLAGAVIEAVLKRAMVSDAALKSHDRGRELSYARHLLWYCLTAICRLGPMELGRAYGRDHSTVIQGIKRIEGELATRAETRADVDAIRAAVKP